MDEIKSARPLPNDNDAEMSILACMILDDDAKISAAEKLSKEDFYYHQNGALFEAILELYNKGVGVDEITLQDRLKEKELPPELASVEYINKLMMKVPVATNYDEYADIVKKLSTSRSIIKLTQGISEACYKGTEDIDSILQSAESEIFKLAENRGNSDFVPIRQVVMNALNRIDAASKQKGNVTGVPTGFTRLDYQTAGLQPSDLILIAARPSMGKTAFVLNIADHICFRQKLSAAVFSLEMSKEQLVNRMFSLESQVDAQKLRTGELQESEWEKLLEAGNIVASSGLIIDDTPGISINELRSKCKKYKAEYDISIVIIDYLQLMTGNSKEGRQQEISQISRSLKALARELNVPVVALSQLSRAVEQRPDHRPMLSDLRESGAIEQDADVVMFIYRDDYYNHDTEKKNISEIIVAKQRNGPIGTIELAWLPQYTKFANKTTDSDSQYLQ